MKTDADMGVSETATKRIKVWDIGTRLFHWILMVLVSLSAYSAFQDKFGIYADMHLWAGLGILTLVGWRIVWGFVGSETSRFSHFVRNPVATCVYAKGAFKKAPYRWIGHNPLGGWSVVLMLFLLVVQASLGLFATDGMIFSGPFSDTIKGSLAGDITELHEITGFTLFGVIGLHVLVIFLVKIRRGTNLVLPMITGYRKNAASEAVQPVLRSPLLAFGLVLVIAGFLFLLIF